MTSIEYLNSIIEAATSIKNCIEKGYYPEENELQQLRQIDSDLWELDGVASYEIPVE